MLPSAPVLFSQILNDDLGCASYLVGCEEAGEVVVVDPHLAIEPILAEAERLDARIVRTLETHTHADHVSGHGRLALDHGIPVSIHPLAEPEYPSEPLDDGTEIAVGTSGSAVSTRRATGRSTAASRSPTPPARTSPGSSSRVTRSSSGTRHDPISQSARWRARRGSSTPSGVCSSCLTVSRSSRVTWPGPSAARR